MAWTGSEWELEDTASGELFFTYQAGSDWGDPTPPFDSSNTRMFFRFDAADGSVRYLHFLEDWDGVSPLQFAQFDSQWYDGSGSQAVPTVLPTPIQLSFIKPKPLAYCNNAIVTLAGSISATDTIIQINEVLDNYDPHYDYMAVFEGATESDHPEIVRASNVTGANNRIGLVIDGVFVTLLRSADTGLLSYQQGTLVYQIISADVPEIGYTGEASHMLVRMVGEGVEIQVLPGTLADFIFTPLDPDGWLNVTNSLAPIAAPATIVYPTSPTLFVTRAQENTTATTHAADARLALGVPTQLALTQMTAALTPDYLIYEEPWAAGFNIAHTAQQNGFARMFPRVDALGNLIPSMWVTAGDADSPEIVLGYEGNYSFNPLNRTLYDADGAEVVNWSQTWVDSESVPHALVRLGEAIRLTGVIIDGNDVTKIDIGNATPGSLTANDASDLSTELAATTLTLGVINALRNRVLDLETILASYAIVNFELN